MADYIHVVGARSGYTKEAFRKEAAALGISRLIGGHMPADIIPGESRIYPIYGAEKDSMPKLCPECRNKLEQLMPPLPSHTICMNPKCHHVIEIRRGGNGEIADWFTPTSIEMVLAVTDANVRMAVEMAQAAGAVNGTLEESTDILRARLPLNSESYEAVKQLVELNGGAGVDIKAMPIDKATGQVVLVAHEPKRLCGYRRHGGKYIVAQVQHGTQSPLVPLPGSVKFVGQAFRGIKRLSDKEADLLRNWDGMSDLEISGEVEVEADVNATV